MNEYDQFTKKLMKEYFSMNELREIVNHPLVAGVLSEEPDDRHKNAAKYSIKLTDGDIYYVYVKH